LARFIKLLKSQNYVLYYGHGKAKEMAYFDIAIVEPSGQSDLEKDFMQSKETLVLAYLSIMEVPSWSEDLKYIKLDDCLKINGQNVMNEQFGNYCADLRSGKWQRMLLNKVSYLLEYRGFDGVFLDTIGFIENKGFPLGLREELMVAASEILNNIRLVFPGHILIQNCGLVEVIKYTKKYINGICWENPPFDQKYYSKLTKTVLKHLKNMWLESGFKTFLLFENVNKEYLLKRYSSEIAQKNNFIIYNSHGNYEKGMNLKGFNN